MTSVALHSSTDAVTSSKKTHQVCHTGLALGEAMSVTTNHLLLIFQVPQYGLHDVPPHDLARHKGLPNLPLSSVGWQYM